jgi:cytochrome c553
MRSWCRRLIAGVAVAVIVLTMPALAAAQDAANGRQLYERLDCARCHAADATGGMGPSLAGTTLSLQEVRAQLREPTGGMMPTFGPERLSDAEVADIYAWLQSSGAGQAFPSWFGTDLINLPTPMLPGERTFEVHFTHRFQSSIRDAGRQGLWGLDSFATPVFWFAYGIRDWLQVHGGRSAVRGTWEYGAKVSLLEEGRVAAPVSVAAVLTGAYVDRDEIIDKNRFSVELPVGVKLHDRVSVVASPFLATNTDATGDPASDDYSAAIGLGGTFRVTPGHSLDVEWITNLGGFESPESVDQWQVFWAIKVGGHLFQIGLTNAVLYTPDQMAPGAQKTGARSDVRLGFNLVRAFALGGG